MTNELQKAFGGSMPTTFDPASLMQSTAKLPVSSDKPYLSFKDGEWTYGSEMAEVESKSLWAVNPNSFHFGLVEWCDGTVGAEILVPAGTNYSIKDLELEFDPNDPKVKEHSVGPHIAVDLYCTTGDDEDVQVQFKTSTRGGVDALNKLAQKISKQAIDDPDNVVALITLESSSYMHKKYRRKTYAPILNIKSFDNFELSGLKKKPSPNKSTKKTATRSQPEPEPEIMEEGPVVPYKRETTSAPPPARRRRNA